METTICAPSRNQAMDLAKLIASFFVVFLHVPFPGRFGQGVSCLARAAVPLFFLLSGYFSYQASPRTLLRRLRHILLLEAAGSGLQILWCLLSPLGWGGSIRDGLYCLQLSSQELLGWLLLNINPFSGPLWFLNALLWCYGLLWCYVRFQKRQPLSYRPLYLLGGLLLAAHFLLGEFAPKIGLSVPYQLPRSALFLGLPLFFLGLLLREFSPALIRRYALSTGKLALLGLLFGLLSLLEQHFLGSAELYLSTLPLVAAVILLTAQHPSLPAPGWLRPLLARLGPWSTGIYLIHLIVLDGYTVFLISRSMQILGALEAYLRPLLILGGSLVLTILWDCLLLAGKRLGRLRC